MPDPFTDDDHDKSVRTSEGTHVGTISNVDGNRATVEATEEDREGWTGALKNMLGWASDDDSHELHGDHVDRRDDDTVYLRNHR